MINWKQVERERAEIERALENGEISYDEARRANRDLDREIADFEREERARRES